MRRLPERSRRDTGGVSVTFDGQDELALVSLKIEETVDALVGRTKAVILKAA